MGAQTSYSNTPKSIITESDNIVIVNYIDGIRGGKSLDVSGYNLDVIKAGHVIIRDTSTDTYKPMPLTATDDTYDSLPANHEYVGILAASTPKDRPAVAILTFGVVNHKATPYPYDSIFTALKSALPQVQFLAD